MVELLSVGDVSVTARCGGPGDVTLADFRTATTGEDFAVSDTSNNEFKNVHYLVIAATSPAVDSLKPATITTVDRIVIVTSIIQLTVNFIDDGVCTFAGTLAVSTEAAS